MSPGGMPMERLRKASSARYKARSWSERTPIYPSSRSASDGPSRPRKWHCPWTALQSHLGRLLTTDEEELDGSDFSRFRFSPILLLRLYTLLSISFFLKRKRRKEI